MTVSGQASAAGRDHDGRRHCALNGVSGLTLIEVSGEDGEGAVMTTLEIVPKKKLELSAEETAAKELVRLGPRTEPVPERAGGAQAVHQET
jgi:hypothetical protein